MENTTKLDTLGDSLASINWSSRTLKPFKKNFLKVSHITNNTINLNMND